MFAATQCFMFHPLSICLGICQQQQTLREKRHVKRVEVKSPMFVTTLVVTMA